MPTKAGPRMLKRHFRRSRSVWGAVVAALVLLAGGESFLVRVARDRDELGGEMASLHALDLDLFRASAPLRNRLAGGYADLGRVWSRLGYLAAFALVGTATFARHVSRRRRQVEERSQNIDLHGLLAVVVWEPTGRLVEWHNAVLHDANGGVSAIISSALYVTERAQSGEAPRESEACYRRLFESNILGIIVTRDDGTIADANGDLRRVLNSLLGSLLALANRPGGDSSADFAELEPLLTTCASLVGAHRAEAAHLAKDRFLAVLSHELRTPLRPDLAAVTAASDDPESGPDLREFREMVRRNVVLDASLGLDAGATHVKVDPARFQQVISNLVKNAVKFTPAGGTISIRTRNEPGPETPASRPRLIIEVADTGASFTVDLATVAAPKDSTPTRRSLDIVLVEDNKDSLYYLTLLLRHAGHIVRPAANLADGIATAESAPFDLLLSDIELPDGTGLDLIRHLVAARPGRFPAIAMSGFGSVEDIQISLEAGFLSHLTKPVDFGRLLTEIDHLVGQSSPDETQDETHATRPDSRPPGQ